MSKGAISTGAQTKDFPFQVWGLTGGIASGKSAAAGFFREEGVPVIDADEIARELSALGGPAHAAIVSRFGTADRAKLRDFVFSDPSARKDLEAILHPMIQAESLEKMKGIAAGQGPERPILYEAALLVETGRHRALKGLIVVDAPRAVRKERLIRRNSLSEELADRILTAQISDEARIQAATRVLPNSGSLEDLRDRVRALMTELGWRLG